MSTFYGTPGNDVISAADVGADTIFGRGGDDEIYAPRPDDIDDSATYFLDGGEGHDFIYGHGIFVEARGGGGNDRFDLSGESVIVRGGAGDDEVSVGANGGSVYGGDGDDIIHATIFPYHPQGRRMRSGGSISAG
jgi:Ca2+-binding RTX toxin-like protein